MSKKTSWIIWYAVILHIVWGVCLMVSDKPTWITAINELTNYISSNVFLGIIMIAAGTLAGLSLWYNKFDFFSLMLLIPQQLLLMLSMFGAIKAINNSSFADGVVRPRIFIFCDQFPAILATITHTIALMHYYTRDVWKRLF